MKTAGSSLHTSDATIASDAGQSPAYTGDPLPSVTLLDKLLVSGAALLVITNVIIYSLVMATKSAQLTYATQQIFAGESL